MITRAKKEEIIRKLTDTIGKAKSVVFVNFHGLGVTDTDKLRTALREKQVTYMVVRKTLVNRVLSGVDVGGEAPSLPGEVAVACGDDPVVPASSIAEFAKQHKENLAIVGGIFEGVFKNREEMENIASIPPLDTLRGMFANVILSPITGLAIALQAVAETKNN